MQAGPLLEIKPVMLTGQVVRLEPLSQAHLEDLTDASADAGIWEFMVYGDLSKPGAMRAWVDYMLDLQKRGADLPFAVVLRASDRAIGATRFMEIRPAHRALEIGGTWYATAYQRTAVNTECKYLMLEHAFERLGCMRVQIKTDARNLRSQRALERIGAVKEGVLRQHMILPDGYRRDSVYYSILDREWPGIKKRLEASMASNRS